MLEVPIVNAFVDQGVGGNPAGVVLDAEALDSAQKQAIAAAVGVSETAFVSPSETADFKLDFFTPTRQIAHCGHATIAAFSFLRQTGRLDRDETSKETIDGRREIRMRGAAAFMEQRAPLYTELALETRRRVLESLRLDESDLVAGVEPGLVNTGNSFLILGLRDADRLAAVRPDLDAVARLSEERDLIGYYLFSTATRHPGRAAGARMFAPRYGINEESATGMAAGPLACYLRDRMGLGESRLLIEQGHLMRPASPSVIEVELQIENGSIVGLMAGGLAAVGEVRGVSI